MPRDPKHSTIWDDPRAPETVVEALKLDPETFFAGFFDGSPEDLQVNILLTLLERKARSERVLERRLALGFIRDELAVAYGRTEA